MLKVPAPKVVPAAGVQMISSDEEAGSDYDALSREVRRKIEYLRTLFAARSCRFRTPLARGPER